MTFAIMLAGECLTTDGTDKGSLVSVGTQMRAKIVCACEAFRAKRALKGCWVLLNALSGASFLALIVGVSQTQCDYIVGNR